MPPRPDTRGGYLLHEYLEEPQQEHDPDGFVAVLAVGAGPEHSRHEVGHEHGRDTPVVCEELALGQHRLLGLQCAIKTHNVRS